MVGQPYLAEEGQKVPDGRAIALVDVTTAFQ